LPEKIWKPNTKQNFMDARLPKGEGLTGSLFATLTTLVAVAALARNFLPPDWIRAIRRLGNKITNYFDPFCYFTFQEFTGQSPDQNYDKVKLYLSGKGIAAARRYFVLTNIMLVYKLCPVVIVKAIHVVILVRKPTQCIVLSGYW